MNMHLIIYLILNINENKTPNKVTNKNNSIFSKEKRITQFFIIDLRIQGRKRIIRYCSTFLKKKIL